ncbi:hypothetical protein [Paraliomyxa miuraensis]|nr:hypothetical protein [Paraliomyxa miuraensis]MCX4239928.1 hypothetical protein [Paraliomyxa miuraensis]
MQPRIFRQIGKRVPIWRNHRIDRARTVLDPAFARVLRLLSSIG